MCGRFNLKRSPKSQIMMESLGVGCEHLRFSSDAAPGSIISIVHDAGHGRTITDAIWWLALEPSTLKPNYALSTFNSRYDKLNVPRSLAYKPYRQSRCIIPATAFAEGLGDKKTYFQIELVDSAISFGGLCRHYVHEETGESVYGASIITLGPAPEWAEIHPKSHPLILPFEEKELIDAWLDPQNTNIEQFAPLLEPRIRFSERVTPIDRPSRWQPIGDSWVIPSSMNG
jgi:putative SOS response-associated peptidase YedK